MSYWHSGGSLALRNTTACEAGRPAALNRRSGREAGDVAARTARAMETVTTKGGGVRHWQQWAGRPNMAGARACGPLHKDSGSDGGTTGVMRWTATGAVWGKPDAMDAVEPARQQRGTPGAGGGIQWRRASALLEI